MKFHVLSSVIFVALMNVTAISGQDIPPGVVNSSFSCAINEGYTMMDVVEVARAIQRDENAPNTIYFREPWVVNSAYNESYDFLVVNYYESFLEMVERVEARRRDNAPIITASAKRHFLDMTDCDTGGRRIDVLRNLPGGNAYDGGTSDETLVATRLCSIKPENDIRGVYGYMESIAQRWQEAGDNTLIQVAHTIMGSQEGVEARSSVWIRRIGANAVDLAKRLDQQNRMLVRGSETERPMVCRDSHLWKSYVIHSTDSEAL